MKLGIRVINFIHIIASFVPLIILLGINISIILRLLLDESGSDVLMGLFVAYILIVGPVFIFVSGIYGLLWIFMLIMSVLELVCAKCKMRQAENVFAVIINVSSYVMSIWLIVFWIFSCLLLFIGFVFIESFISIFYLNYISMVVAGVSVGASVLYTAGLIADKFQKKGASNAEIH